MTVNRIFKWTVLVDLSGTIHTDDNMIPGASEALIKLRKLPVNVKFVTNTTKESSNTLYQRLVRIGFKIEQSEIFTCLTAARQMIDHQKLRPMLLLEDDSLNNFIGVDQTNPNAVVVGLAPTKLKYEIMNEAFRLLINNPSAPLIGIHKSKYYKRSDGLALGPGPFVAALEFATDRPAIVVGKPMKEFFMSALRTFANSEAECAVDNAFMIGDDVCIDVEGAQLSGMKGILVKTGKYLKGDENKINPMPWKTVETINEAIDQIQNHINNGTK